MPKKPITTDQLAQMIERHTAKKEDVVAVRKHLETLQGETHHGFNAVRREVHESEERLLDAI